MKQRLILMSGIPGSGKSTFVQNHLDEHTVWISRDEVRFFMVAENEEYFSKEDEVFKEYIRRIENALSNGYSVFADATHLDARSRTKVLRPLEKIIKANDVGVYVCFMDVDLKTALKQNAQRQGRALVPKSAILNMSLNLKTPSKEEGYIYLKKLNNNVILYKKGR